MHHELQSLGTPRVPSRDRVVVESQDQTLDLRFVWNCNQTTETYQPIDHIPLLQLVAQRRRSLVLCTHSCKLLVLLRRHPNPLEDFLLAQYLPSNCHAMLLLAEPMRFQHHMSSTFRWNTLGPQQRPLRVIACPNLEVRTP